MVMIVARGICHQLIAAYRPKAKKRVIRGSCRALRASLLNTSLCRARFSRVVSSRSTSSAACSRAMALSGLMDWSVSVSRASRLSSRVVWRWPARFARVTRRRSRVRMMAPAARAMSVSRQAMSRATPA